MKLARSFGRNLHIKKDTVYFLFFNQNVVLKGGELSSQFRWFTIAKIEL